MGGIYKVREAPKPQTYKPKTLEPQEAPLPQPEKKISIKDRIEEIKSGSYGKTATQSHDKKPTPIVDKQVQKSVLVGYVGETLLPKSGPIMREALLYLNYAEATKGNNKEILWKEADYKLRVVDYRQQQVEKLKQQLDAQNEPFPLPKAGQKTAVVTEYDFDIHGQHKAGTGVAHLENIDMENRHTQKDVVSTDEINRDVKNPKKIECVLQHAEYADAHEPQNTNKTQKVFALAIKGPHSVHARDYAITSQNSLHYAYPPKKMFMGKSEPLDIAAYVKNLNNKIL